MRKIVILMIPPGPAPREWRMAWVDLELPLVEKTYYPQKNEDDNSGGYEVAAKDAISELRENHRNDAADYWNKYFKTGNICFNQYVCKIKELTPA